MSSIFSTSVHSMASAELFIQLTRLIGYDNESLRAFRHFVDIKIHVVFPGIVYVITKWYDAGLFLD